MENSIVGGLRSRSRSKTPFLRSSCDHENCTEVEEHTHHKSGRRTPIKRSTPIKQLQQNSKRTTIDPVDEEIEEVQTTHRTRQSTRSEKLIKTSDYSSEESLDRLRGHRKEIIQNELNSQYERVSTSTGYSTLADVTLSPINVRNVTQDRSTRFSSPAYSACSTDSSFAEQALADASVLLDREPNTEHLPYKLYKMAGEYWNKYPKTDYTYSPLSRDRVELAPGQIAVPNMSRRSLSQFRVQGPNTVDEPDIPYTRLWTTTTRKRFTTVDSSDDEGTYIRSPYKQQQQHWWITQLLISMVTAITTTTSNAYRQVFGPSHRYPYTERNPKKAGIMSSTASAVAAPFYWIYTMIKTVVTTTVTTVTETFTSDAVSESGKKRQVGERRWWPWLLLLLLPAFGYGLHYTYENMEHLAMPNFTDFYVDLSEFSLPSLPTIRLPEILPKLNISVPDINITLPNVYESLPALPEVTKTYTVYKEVVQNRMADASDYVKVVADSCMEEIRRVWSSYIG